MTAREKMIAIYVPESLIPDLLHHVGPVLFYMDNLMVEDGFALAKDEYVASVISHAEASIMAGMPLGSIAIIENQD